MNAIGNAKARKKLVDKLRVVGVNLPVIIHPKVTVASGAMVDGGTVIMAGAVVKAVQNRTLLTNFASDAIVS